MKFQASPKKIGSCVRTNQPNIATAAVRNGNPRFRHRRWLPKASRVAGKTEFSRVDQTLFHCGQRLPRFMGTPAGQQPLPLLRHLVRNAVILLLVDIAGSIDRELCLHSRAQHAR